VEGGAKGERSVGVDGIVAFVDEADDAPLVDDDIGAKSPPIVLVFDAVRFQDAVGSDHLVVHVTEQRKVESVLLGEGGVGGGTVHADAKYGGVGGGYAAGVYAGLHGSHLRGTAFREGQHVNGEEDVFLVAVVAEAHGFPVVGEKDKVRRHVAHFQGHVRHFRFVHLVSQPGHRRRNHQK